MTNFDIRTVFLIVGLLYLLLPTITWFTLAAQRSRQIDLWCGGGLLIGAAWLDGGPDAAQQVFDHVYDVEQAEPGLGDPFDGNPKSALQAYVQMRFKSVPVYVTESSEGPSHCPLFRVSARIGDDWLETAEGPSKRTAETLAAERLLARLRAAEGAAGT